jgi:TP901 family phage tail tape measure protein
VANDVNANIRVDIDTSEALNGLRQLQTQISNFNKSVIQSNASAAAAQRSMLSTMNAQIGASRQFSTSITSVETSFGRLQNSIDRNKLSMGEYFRYGVASSKNFSKIFKRENLEITRLATERVRRLQTQYIALGESHNGMTKAMQVRPLQLFNADAAVAIQRQQIFNKLLRDGSTSLVNFGKNTQWAGRQLMVGFTVPLTIFGGMASKTFMELEEQAIAFRKVYGDIFTTDAEVQQNLEAVRELSLELTKYGIAARDTFELANIAAQAGARGADLIAQTQEATRLAVLGQMEQQEAVRTTITLQNSFRLSNEELAESINFLNIVENQSVLSLQDVSGAIPRVAPVIRSLGGDVRDLAVMLTAMREGGVSAAEGANALKTSLARLISPTAGAISMSKELGINLEGIVEANQGDILGAVMQLADAMKELDGLASQRLLSEIFGKRQYARVGALFNNITDEASQAQRVLGLTTMSVEELAETANRELGQVEQSIATKFTAALEKLKVTIAPIGEQFLKLATPLLEQVSKLFERFNDLSPTVKNFITILVTGLGVVTPVVLMLIGLFANFAGNAIKGIALMRNFFLRLKGGADATAYLAGAELDAAAAAASLEGRTSTLTSALNIQRGAVDSLTSAYARYVSSASAAAASLPQGFRPPARRMATGGMVGGTGNRDTEPALLTPGEFVINADASKKFAPLLNAINSGMVGKYARGRSPSIYGGQEVVLAPHTMLAPGNTPGGFGMSREFFSSGSGFEQSLRATAIATAGIEGNIRLTEKAVAEMSSELGPYTQEIVDDLRRTAQEMEESGQSAQHISEVFKKAEPRLQKTFAKMERAGGTAASASAGLRKFAFPTEAEMYAEGERRVPGGTIAQSGAVRRTEYRSRQSASLSRIRSVYGKMFGRVPRGYTAAHVTPESQKLLGDVVPLRGAGVGMDPTQTAKLTAYIQKKSKENAATYSNTFSSEISKQDPTARGLAMERGRRSPHRQAVANATQDAIGYANNYGINLNNELSRKLGPQMAKITGGASGPSSPWPGPGVTQATNNLVNQTNQAATQMSKARSAASRFGGALIRGSAKLSGATMAISSLTLGLSFMDNGVGEFAQKIMPATFALTGIQQVLPMISRAAPLLANPFVAAGVAVAAVAASMYLVKRNADNMAKKGEELSDAMLGTKKALDGYAQFFEKETATQKLAKSRVEEATGQRQTSESLEQASAFLASEFGNQLVEDVTKARDMVGARGAGEALGNQLQRMLLAGIIDSDMAYAIATQVGKEIGDSSIATKVSANLSQVIGPNGQNLLDENQRLEIFANIIADATSVQNSMREAGMIWDGMGWIGQVSMIVTGKGTSDIAAENVAQNLINVQSLIGEELARNQLAYDQGSISAKRFYEQNLSIIESARNMGVSWENAITKFSTAYEGQDIAHELNIINQDLTNSLRDALRPELGQDFEKLIVDPLKGAADQAVNVNNSLDLMYSQRGYDLFDAESVTDTLNSLETDIRSFDEEIRRVAEKGETTVYLEQARDILKEQKELIETQQRGVMNIAVAVSSGMLSSETIANLLENDIDFPELSLMISAIPDNSMVPFLTLLEQSKGEGVVADFVLNITSSMTPQQIEEISGPLVNLINLPPVVINATMSQLVNGTPAEITDELKRIRRGARDLDKLNKPKKVQIYMEDNFSSVVDQFTLDYNWIASLPPQQKFVYFDYITRYQTMILPELRGDAAGRAALAAGKAGPYGSLPTPPAQKEPPEIKPPEDDEDTGGGGKTKETPVKDFKNAIIEQLRIYTDINALIPKLKDQKKKLAEVVDELGFNRSLVAQMRAAGLSEANIAELISKGAKDAKRIFNSLNSASNQGQIETYNLASAMGSVGKAVSENISAAKAARNETIVTMDLVKEGIDEETAANIASNKELAESLMLLPRTSKAFKQFVRSVKELESASLSTEVIKDKIDELRKKMEDELRPLQDQIEKQNDIVDAIQERIDNQEELNTKDQDLIRNADRQIEMLERQVEQTERLNESDERRIQGLNRENELRERIADSLNRELEQMSRIETEIRDAYQERIDALDKVASINEYISRQQKEQLNISRALSEGDVYAAAAAAQAMQQATSGYAQDQIRSGLDDAMENQIAGLRTSGGLTREQAEQQILNIQEQSYQVSLQIRDIEDVIYQRNLDLLPIKDDIQKKSDDIRIIQDRIYDRETEILNITRQELEPAQKLLSQYEKQRLSIEKQYNDKIDSLELAQDLDDATLSQLNNVNGLALAWYQVKKQIKEAQQIAAREMRDLGDRPTRIEGESGANYRARLEEWKDRRRDIKQTEKDAIAAAEAAGSLALGAVNNYAGGLVSGSGARDSITSRLTPGEFVVRKSMVEKYGQSMFRDINMGSFAMPRYNVDAVPQASTGAVSSNVVSNINAPVYNNYDMEFNINGANANADEIAQRVMMKIRNVDSASIRGINGY